MTKKVFNALVFPGGTEIGLEIHNSLARLKEVRLFAATAPVSSHASLVFKNCFIVPPVNQEGWVEELNRVVEENKIDFILPAHDDVVLALAENAAKIRAAVILPPLRTCQITRSKAATYDLFEGILPVPARYATADEIPAFPVFLKPDKGQGSWNTHLAYDKEHVQSLKRKFGDLLILEFLPGAEYTVDCFSDREKGLLFCGGRERIRTKNGIAMHTRAVSDPQFRQFAETIAKQLEMRGAWFFQVKKDAAGRLKLLEIAPRVSGTMGYHRVLGVNMPLLSLYEQQRIPVRINPVNADVEMDRALVNRYKHHFEYACVYIDLDDMILVDGKVNLLAIRFLYQCVNEGKRLVLVTKHAADVHQTLKRHRLEGIFDEIVHLSQTQHKRDVIVEKSAVFIDDSFSERQAVSEARGIPTFDTSMLEVLLDERH